VGEAHADEGAAAGEARPAFSRSLRPSFDISRGTCAGPNGQRLPQTGRDVQCTLKKAFSKRLFVRAA
jgi:hypothetical protein